MDVIPALLPNVITSSFARLLFKDEGNYPIPISRRPNQTLSTTYSGRTAREARFPLACAHSFDAPMYELFCLTSIRKDNRRPVQACLVELSSLHCIPYWWSPSSP